jgi:hypothetical protein
MRRPPPGRHGAERAHLHAFNLERAAAAAAPVDLRPRPEPSAARQPAASVAGRSLWKCIHGGGRRGCASPGNGASGRAAPEIGLLSASTTRPARARLAQGGPARNLASGCATTRQESCPANFNLFECVRSDISGGKPRRLASKVAGRFDCRGEHVVVSQRCCQSGAAATGAAGSSQLPARKYHFLLATALPLSQKW